MLDIWSTYGRNMVDVWSTCSRSKIIRASDELWSNYGWTMLELWYSGVTWGHIGMTWGWSEDDLGLKNIWKMKFHIRKKMICKNMKNKSKSQPPKRGGGWRSSATIFGFQNYENPNCSHPEIRTPGYPDAQISRRPKIPIPISAEPGSHWTTPLRCTIVRSRLQEGGRAVEGKAEVKEGMRGWEG